MNAVDDTRLYTIGELARRTGLSVKTIRFYSDSGVVPPADRTPVGYRLYDVVAVSRLELVRTLRELGAGLPEVRRVLAAETTLAKLAERHLELLERQLRVLQTRRAVLRAVVKLDRSTEEVRLMHKLAQLSDEERNRLIDEFWDEVSADLTVTPGFTEWMRSAKPKLPDDPSAEQVAAWIELAELVQDPDFRQATRAMYEDHARRLAAGERLGVPSCDAVERWQAVLDEAHAAAEAEHAPTGPRGRELADRLIALATEQSGEQDSPEHRRRLADGFAGHDDRMSRYWELLAAINGWPVRRTTERSTRWLAEALRASAR
ncbi:MerR family transcriptional regulator [Saccharopolyspora rosea]